MKNLQDFQRRKPRQSRSRMTYDSILEAAAQLLRHDGPAALNTNRVAERAGVSVGTLYQYFPNKGAILLALARREISGLNASAFLKALVEALLETLETFGKRDAPRTKRPAGSRVRKTRLGNVSPFIALFQMPASYHLLPVGRSP